MLTNIISKWDAIQKLKDGEMPLPRFVDFHSSNVCNMHCVGCQYDGRLSKDYMSEEDHFTVVNKFLKAGVKAFDFCGGGEPLIPPYMERLIRHINANGAYSAFLSNGSIMPDGLAQTIVDCSTYIRVSLEASNEMSYAAYKKVPTYMWHRVLGNIGKLQSLKKESKSDLEVSIKFGVSKDLRGARHYMDALMLGTDLEAKRITFRAIRDNPNELSLEEKKWENSVLESVLDKWGKDVRDRVSYWLVPIPFEQVPQCWLNPFHTVVHWNGDMHVCCYGYYRPEQMYLGNIIKQSFDEIWFSEKHWDVINGIKREDCARVDCKFFLHDRAVREASRRDVIEWL